MKKVYGKLLLTLSLTLMNIHTFAEGSSYIEQVKEKSSNQSLFSFENIILALIAGLVIYMFYIKPGKTKSKKAIEGKTTQDLIYYKEIEPDGLVVLPDNKYRRMLEITPINISIKSPAEQAVAWEEYRNTIDSVSVDWTQIIQTRILRFKDFVDEQQKRNLDIKQKHQKLYEHLNQVLSEMVTEYEEHERRERKYFIILKVDAEENMEGSSSLSSENAVMSAFTKNMGGGKKKFDEKELRNIAEAELNNAAVIIANGLSRAGIGTKMLNKYGVLDYFNHTYNRDMAYVQDVEETIAQGVLSQVKTSTTVEDFIKELQLDLVTIERNANAAKAAKEQKSIKETNKEVAVSDEN